MHQIQVQSVNFQAAMILKYSETFVRKAEFRSLVSHHLRQAFDVLHVCLQVCSILSIRPLPNHFLT